MQDKKTHGNFHYRERSTLGSLQFTLRNAQLDLSEDVL